MLIHYKKYSANVCLSISLLVGFSVTGPTAALPSKSVMNSAPYVELINTTTTLSAKLLHTTAMPLTSTKNSKENAEISTKAHSSTRSPSVMDTTTREMHERTKAEEAISSRGKLNTTSVGDNRARTAAAVAPTRSSGRLQELGPIDCDLLTLPRESRLWRANETHELNIPFIECLPASSAPAAPDEECSPDVLLWEGTADMQTGDILIVRINDTQLQVKNTEKIEGNTNNTLEAGKERPHPGQPQPAVYQVTRLGHEHCDTADGALLDVTPLDDDAGVKIFTLYDKVDLSEGVNLFIVVAENWGPKCVRLRVTVKSDNCGESQECSGKGVCFTNISMEGYECQCCPGFVGPHCDERNACDPTPCLNNGICVAITQPRNTSAANFHCLCPYGFTGKNCEKDPCYSSPCLNGGSCMSMSVNGTTTRFHCACANGWAGDHCQLSAASGGACASNPCANGICIDQTDGDIDAEPFKCYCQPGFTGDHCELEYNECESSPCANGGTCTDRVAGFSCACRRGFTGNACQLKVDLCSPNPCSSRRLCIDHGNSYSCDCPRGYIGDECSVLAQTPCEHNPCAHGGTCWNGMDRFYCTCRPGYTGSLCEDDFIIESVVGGEGADSVIGSGSVRDMGLPFGLYHDRLHNVYIAVGTLGAAIAIVGVVVTACHCRVNKTYSRLLSRVIGRRAPATAGVTEGSRHWLHRRPPSAPSPPAPAPLLDHDMYYTLDFSDSQTSPLIQ